MSNTQTIEKIQEEVIVNEPKMYKVILHNDNSTTFEFVIVVLTKIFHRTLEDSLQLTEQIHLSGQGVAGAPYTHEIAKEKTLETISFSRANGFPLIATFEEI